MANGLVEKQVKNMNKQFTKEELTIVKEYEKILNLTRNQGNVSENGTQFYPNQIVSLTVQICCIHPLLKCVKLFPASAVVVKWSPS